jgi:hypothetical protein
MNIRVFKKLDNGVYQISVHTTDWSESDKALMVKYGEPTIDLGGSFVGETPYLEYVLSTKLVLIMSESPFTQRFDSRDAIDADDRATLWKTTIVERITYELLNLRAHDDTFTGEEVTTL